MPSFDARALTEPVDRAAVKRFAQEIDTRYPRSTGATVAFVAAIAFAVVIGIMIVVIGGGAVLLAVATGLSAGDGGPGLVGFLPLLFFGGVAAVVVVGVVVSSRRMKERRWRLDRFARANGMAYIPTHADPPLPGMVFGIGGSRRSDDIVRGTTPRFVEFGNYQYTTGSGKNRSTHRWGYVAIRLDAPLPHIVLDALGNNTVFGSNLPVGFRTDQRLSLEGDFDEHFALYCPEGYEADALYLFTPDVMARFLDNVGRLDVEIVDDWMFLYTRRQVSTLDPATWQWMFSVVGALIGKLDQWGRWRDERLAASPAGWAPGSPAAGPLPFSVPAATAPPRGVASEGRRLRRRFSWLGLVFLVLAVVGWFLPLLTGD
ncbi:hypothetical protein [Microbacterium gilvum]|uniref:DUF3137 domain-containing protein n=1 Tax=Microbacterium gilvum TaxID=1336204 RepID=A0ABP9A651_9MICO